MRKLVSLALVLVLTMACVSLVACRGGEEEPEAAQRASATAMPEPEETATVGQAAAGVAGFSWDDMPLYPGAEEDEDAVSVAGASEEGARVEWRHYKTTDGFGQVVEFYKAQMPAQGWKQVVWTDMEPAADEWSQEGGVFAKDEDRVQASVEITDQGEGVVTIDLMRASYQEDAVALGEASSESAASGDAGFSWDDVPAYPRADADQSAWVTVAEGEGFRSETRIYRTSDDAATVADFYKAEMPKNGWDQQMWTSAGELEMGAYAKNDGQETAQVMIMDDGDQGVQIQLTRVHEEE